MARPFKTKYRTRSRIFPTITKWSAKRCQSTNNSLWKSIVNIVWWWLRAFSAFRLTGTKLMPLWHMQICWIIEDPVKHLGCTAISVKVSLLMRSKMLNVAIKFSILMVKSATLGFCSIMVSSTWITMAMNSPLNFRSKLAILYSLQRMTYLVPLWTNAPTALWLISQKIKPTDGCRIYASSNMMETWCTSCKQRAEKKINKTETTVTTHKSLAGRQKIWTSCLYKTSYVFSNKSRKCAQKDSISTLLHCVLIWKFFMQTMLIANSHLIKGTVSFSELARKRFCNSTLSSLISWSHFSAWSGRMQKKSLRNCLCSSILPATTSTKTFCLTC